MNKRFTVETAGAAWRVVDTEHKNWNMPEKAVSLNFASKVTAEGVAEILNDEWEHFLRNPN